MSAIREWIFWRWHHRRITQCIGLRVDRVAGASRTSAFAFKGREYFFRYTASVPFSLMWMKCWKVVCENQATVSCHRAVDKITRRMDTSSSGRELRSQPDRYFWSPRMRSAGLLLIAKRKPGESRDGHLIWRLLLKHYCISVLSRGLHFCNKLTPADSRKAIECLNRQLQLNQLNITGLRHDRAYTSRKHPSSSGQMLPDRAFEIVHRYADKSIRAGW